MNQNLLREPIDKVCFSLIAILILVIGFLLEANKICISGKCPFKNYTRIREFSWHNRKIAASDTAFILTFERPMDRQSVEKSLVIEPPLPGRISWAGKRLVYTLDSAIPYGKNYRLSLRGARERLRGKDNNGAVIETFVAEFQSRDRAFAYLGSEGEDTGKLILYNLTKQNKTTLSPDHLTVVDFKFSPNGEYIIFSATARDSGIEGLRNLQLYKVTTGLSSTNRMTKIPGEIELILDNKDYQNNKFDLAGENGEKIIVQRINRENPADFDLWLVEAGNPPQRLNNQGGEFVITPDGKAIAIAQGEGIAIIPLEVEAKPLDFLPKYGRILTFSNNGVGAAMVNFNTDNPQLRYTRSLVYVNNQGIEKELLNIKGSIIDCKFNPSGSNLYCLLTELIEGEKEYREQPYFALIDINSAKVIPIVALPDYQDIELSIAPDGFGILFDQIITSEGQKTDGEEELITDSAESIVGSRLWLLTLPSLESSTPKLEELAIAGFNPQWSP